VCCCEGRAGMLHTSPHPYHPILQSLAQPLSRTTSVRVGWQPAAAIPEYRVPHKLWQLSSTDLMHRLCTPGLPPPSDARRHQPSLQRCCTASLLCQGWPCRGPGCAPSSPSVTVSRAWTHTWLPCVADQVCQGHSVPTAASHQGNPLAEVCRVDRRCTCTGAPWPSCPACESCT
jgi:hypothetical protein